MKYKIHFILIILSAIIAIVGGILVLVGLFTDSKYDGGINTPYLYGGLVALVNAAILYGYAYIVKACVIYSEKFFAEYNNEELSDEIKKMDGQPREFFSNKKSMSEKAYDILLEEEKVDAAARLRRAIDENGYIILEQNEIDWEIEAALKKSGLSEGVVWDNGLKVTIPLL